MAGELDHSLFLQQKIYCKLFLLRYLLFYEHNTLFEVHWLANENCESLFLYTHGREPHCQTAYIRLVNIIIIISNDNSCVCQWMLACENQWPAEASVKGRSYITMLRWSCHTAGGLCQYLRVFDEFKGAPEWLLSYCPLAPFSVEWEYRVAQHWTWLIRIRDLTIDGERNTWKNQLLTASVTKWGSQI